MTDWTAQQLQAIGAAEEIQVVTTRRDGTDRLPVTIWAVADAGRVFLRSTNGRGAGWFTTAVSNRRGTLTVGGRRYAVHFAEAEADDLPAVDAAYRAKYGRYASIVDHLVSPGPREATLSVRPADL